MKKSPKYKARSQKCQPFTQGYAGTPARLTERWQIWSAAEHLWPLRLVETTQPRSEAFFGLRPSHFGLPSAFGLRPSDFYCSHA